MTSTSHCVQDFSSPSSRRKKSTTPVQSPQKAKEVLKAPSLALQSTNNNRHPRSNAAKSVKNLQNFKQVSQLICVYVWIYFTLSDFTLSLLSAIWTEGMGVGESVTGDFVTGSFSSMVAWFNLGVHWTADSAGSCTGFTGCGFRSTCNSGLDVAGTWEPLVFTAAEPCPSVCWMTTSGDACAGCTGFTGCGFRNTCNSGLGVAGTWEPLASIVTGSCPPVCWAGASEGAHDSRTGCGFRCTCNLGLIAAGTWESPASTVSESCPSVWKVTAS